MSRNIIALSFAAALALSSCQDNSPSADNDSLVVNTPMAGEAETANMAQATGLDTAFVTDGIKGDTAEVAIANLASGISPTQLSHGEVMETGERVQSPLGALLEGIIARL